jgi:hypothetical protein
MVVQCETWVWAWFSLILVLWELLNTLREKKDIWNRGSYEILVHLQWYNASQLESTIRLVLVPYQFPRLEEHSKVWRKFTFSLSKSLLRLVYANIVYCKSHYFHKYYNLSIWVKFFLLSFWICQLKSLIVTCLWWRQQCESMSKFYEAHLNVRA